MRPLSSHLARFSSLRALAPPQLILFCFGVWPGMLAVSGRNEWDEVPITVAAPHLGLLEAFWNSPFASSMSFKSHYKLHEVCITAGAIANRFLKGCLRLSGSVRQERW